MKRCENRAFIVNDFSYNLKDVEIIKRFVHRLRRLKAKLTMFIHERVTALLSYSLSFVVIFSSLGILGLRHKVPLFGLLFNRKRIWGS